MKSMWRMWLLVGAVVVLSACGSAPAELPQAYEKNASPVALAADASTIVDGWQREARAGMLTGLIKEDSLEEISYQSTSDATTVAEYYNKLLGTDGWVYLPRTPGEQQGYYLAGYTHGNSSLVLGVLDLTAFGQTGSFVYLIHGHK